MGQANIVNCDGRREEIRYAGVDNDVILQASSPTSSKHLSSLLTFPWPAKTLHPRPTTQFAKVRQHHKLVFFWLDWDKLSSSENTSFAARQQNEAEIILSKKLIQRKVYCKSMTQISTFSPLLIKKTEIDE